MIWFAIASGVSLSSAVTHVALGLRRPVQPTHLLFALLMLLISPFQLVLASFHAARSPESVVTLGRYGVVLGILAITVFAVFAREYTQARVPRGVAYAFLAINALWLVYDLIAPRGLLFTSSVVPASTGTTSGGFTRVPVGPVELLWHAFNTATVLWGVVGGWRMVLSGRRSQGLALALGMTAFLATVLIDAVRDALGRDWVYLGGYGAMVMAVLLSAQLAWDFREGERRLSRLARESMRIRDELNTPLQTLHIGLELAATRGSVEPDRLEILRRALNTLTRLGRNLRI
jgi:hypothetical protein